MLTHIKQSQSEELWENFLWKKIVKLTRVRRRASNSPVHFIWSSNRAIFSFIFAVDLPLIFNSQSFVRILEFSFLWCKWHLEDCESNSLKKFLWCLSILDWGSWIINNFQLESQTEQKYYLSSHDRMSQHVIKSKLESLYKWCPLAPPTSAFLTVSWSQNIISLATNMRSRDKI